MNKTWVTAINELNTNGESFVLITLLSAKGSTPRNSGTKMVITRDQQFDSIGGGHLEYRVIARARELLGNQADQQLVEHFSLGPSLGQCCGGSTSVLFECFNANVLNLAVFGAGHVGQALIPILSRLPCQIRWIDSRNGFFPSQLPASVTTIHSEHPVDEIPDMPAHSYYLIMTHNHQLDFDLVEAILRREDSHYLGLIGSNTKWRRFKKRLQHKQVADHQIEQVQCPVGLAEIPGKHPMEIAVSIAAQLIQQFHQHTAHPVATKTDRS